MITHATHLTYSALDLKVWSIFAQSSNTQEAYVAGSFRDSRHPRSLRPCLRRSSGVPPSRPTPAHEARIQVLRVSGRWMVPTDSGKEQSASQRSSTASPQPPGGVHPTRRRRSASSWETKRQNSTTIRRTGQSRTRVCVWERVVVRFQVLGFSLGVRFYDRFTLSS